MKSVEFRMAISIFSQVFGESREFQSIHISTLDSTLIFPPRIPNSNESKDPLIARSFSFDRYFSLPITNIQYIAGAPFQKINIFYVSPDRNHKFRSIVEGGIENRLTGGPRIDTASHTAPRAFRKNTIMDVSSSFFPCCRRRRLSPVGSPSPSTRLYKQWKPVWNRGIRYGRICIANC